MNIDEATEKARLVMLTDPDEIESVKRNGFNDIIGAIRGDYCYAYKWSVERYRNNKLKGE